MRLHRFLTAAGLTALVCAPLIAPSPAMAWGGWGTGNIAVPSPPTIGPTPEVAQGGQNNLQTPQVQTTPQTAEVPNGDGAYSSPTFVAPGVERNGDGELERSP
jgi:hypothetical protein